MCFIIVKILSHTGLIDSGENSEVEAYLHKVLKDGVAGNNARNEEVTADSSRVITRLLALWFVNKGTSLCRNDTLLVCFGNLYCR